MMRSPERRRKNEKIPGLRFVRRMFLMRMLGTFLCFFPILSVLHEQHTERWHWLLLAANAFLWPGFAFWRARRAVTPLRAEHQNLIFDAAAGGFWIAMMHLNPLPSVVIATILLADRLSAGGYALMRKAAIALGLTFVFSWAWLGMPVAGYVTQRTMLATLPLIAIYLLALSALTDWIATRLREKSRELEHIAMMDPFLDIANRRLLEIKINSELNKLNGDCHHSTLMYIDIDDFKSVNDRFGHKVGDTLLIAVSDILRIVTRQTDTPARLGGDEFVVLLPETTLEQAYDVGRRIMDAVTLLRLSPDRALDFTLSIGIASATHTMADVTDWLKAADDALYQAKRQGKNRIFAH
mgnify:FL=1|uniref:diguanylate cyclase n=2 Tax=Siccibacter turicensis TaxID=357233 RepID=C7C500_9ENTR|nr:hypothetical protein [Siccibacter turicensis LMG 23730]